MAIDEKMLKSIIEEVLKEIGMESQSCKEESKP